MPSSSISGAERAEDIAPAFEAIEGRADALYVIPDPIVNTNRIRINTLALGARLPTMLGTRDAAREAGLMSYGPNNAELFRRAGDYVDKILRGAKPGDIPVEQPTKFDLVVPNVSRVDVAMTRTERNAVAFDYFCKKFKDGINA